MNWLAALNGEPPSSSAFRAWQSWSDRLICADGAAGYVTAFGATPNFLIGDFDSVERALMNNLDPSFTNLLHRTDQNFSDFDKLLRFIEQESTIDPTSVPRCAVLGIDGGLPDHSLGNLLSAARSPLPELVLVFERGVGVVLNSVRSSVCAPPSSGRISLLPLEACAGVSLTGVQWPLENASLGLSGRLSLSNQGNGETIQARVSSGSAFLFIEGSALPDQLPTSQCPQA